MSNTDSSTNQETRQAYEKNVKTYVAKTPQTIDGHFKQYLDRIISLSTPGGSILELGSATGRDADYFESQGFRVDRTDAVQGFVDLMRSQGHQARLLDAVTDEFGGPYDVIFANAVLLHFTPEQTKQVLQKAHQALKSEGIVAFSVKQGEGSGWSEEKLGGRRFFQYWQLDELKALLQTCGFRVMQSEIKPSQTRPGTIWLRFIARKV